MKVTVTQQEDGTWQADSLLPDGTDVHARGREAADALIELGIFIKSRPKVPDPDMQTLGRVLQGEFDFPSPITPSHWDDYPGRVPDPD